MPRLIYAFAWTLAGLPLDQALAQKRLVPITELATSADLPIGALSAGAFAEVQAEFDVTTEGRVENCRTTYANNIKLRKVTCDKIAERARYSPAYDKLGGKIRSRDMINVYWAAAPAQTMVGLNDFGGAMPNTAVESWKSLPSLKRRPKRQGSTIVRFEIKADGRVGNCVVVIVRGEAAIADELCNSLQGWARFRPPVDEQGAPYAVVGSTKFDWLGADDVPAYRRR